jgi:hypothetical protein
MAGAFVLARRASLKVQSSKFKVEIVLNARLLISASTQCTIFTLNFEL